MPHDYIITRECSSHRDGDAESAYLPPDGMTASISLTPFDPANALPST